MPLFLPKAEFVAVEVGYPKRHMTDPIRTLTVGRSSPSSCGIVCTIGMVSIRYHTETFTLHFSTGTIASPLPQFQHIQLQQNKLSSPTFVVVETKPSFHVHADAPTSLLRARYILSSIDDFAKIRFDVIELGPSFPVRLSLSTTSTSGSASCAGASRAEGIGDLKLEIDQWLCVGTQGYLSITFSSFPLEDLPQVEPSVAISALVRRLF
jgi:hypothetical protein